MEIEYDETCRGFTTITSIAFAWTDGETEERRTDKVAY